MSKPLTFLRAREILVEMIAESKIVSRPGSNVDKQIIICLEHVLEMFNRVNRYD